MKLGSLCTGYGGLDMAVADVFGPVDLRWFADIDPRAAAVFSAHHLGVPNLGDLTTIIDPPPVDILTGGFPCQPVSSAGKRAGTDDDRWLFDDICTLVGRMDPRPRLLVFENVLGLLTANDGNAMVRVVHGLARLGYMGSWRVVRASDVGACHQRARVFIVARNATQSVGRVKELQLLGATGRSAAEPREPDSAPTTDALRAGAGRDGGAVPRTATGARRTRADLRAAVDGGAVAADTDGTRSQGTQPARRRDVSAGRFGPYTAAVDRWAAVLGRPAPDPTDTRGRLSPVFVEWMMGLPEGWVTDHEPARTHALRILGNGVVPQQAAHALRLLVGAS